MQPSRYSLLISVVVLLGVLLLAACANILGIEAESAPVGESLICQPAECNALERQVIAAGYRHTCAVLHDRTARCWGQYRLDGATTADTITTVPLAVDLMNVAAITAGDGYTCALIDNGTINCWGRNQYGQLGNGLHVDSNAPMETYTVGART